MFYIVNSRGNFIMGARKVIKSFEILSMWEPWIQWKYFCLSFNEHLTLHGSSK